MSTNPGLAAGGQSDADLNRVLYVVPAGLILGVIGVVIAVTHDPAPSLVVRYIAVGLAYLAGGYWLSAKGYGRLGLLLALTGAFWFVPELEDSGQRYLVGLAILLESAYFATYAHAALAYPSGKIRPKGGVWLLRAGYAIVFLGGLARALTYQPYYWQSCDCPHNGFAVWHSQSLYDAIDGTFGALLLIFGIVLIAVIALKLQPENRDRAAALPVWAALVGTTLIVVSGVARDQLDLSHSGLILWLWVEGIGLLLAGFSFLVLGRNQSSQAEPSL